MRSRGTRGVKGIGCLASYVINRGIKIDKYIHLGEPWENMRVV